MDYSREWLRLYKASTAMRTKEMYERIIEGHISIDPCVRLQDFRTVHMLNIFQHAAGHKKTQEQILMTIKQVIKQAVRDRRYSSTDAEDLFESFPKVKYAPGEKRPLTESEKEAVFKAELQPMDKAYLYLIYGCGLRREEALALYKYDFNWKRKEVNINKAHTMSGSRTEEKETKTSNGVRTVPIPDSVRPYLEEYVKDCKTTALFRMRNGNPITKSSYDKMWRRILRGLQAVSEEPIEGADRGSDRSHLQAQLYNGAVLPDTGYQHQAYRQACWRYGSRRPEGLCSRQAGSGRRARSGQCGAGVITFVITFVSTIEGQISYNRHTTFVQLWPSKLRKTTRKNINYIVLLYATLALPEE